MECVFVHELAGQVQDSIGDGSGKNLHFVQNACDNSPTLNERHHEDLLRPRTD